MNVVGIWKVKEVFSLNEDEGKWLSFQECMDNEEMDDETKSFLSARFVFEPDGLFKVVMAIAIHQMQRRRCKKLSGIYIRWQQGHFLFMAPSQVFENKFKARHSDAVAQCPVTGRICCSRDRCPVVREPLEALTLYGHQPADIQS